MSLTVNTNIINDTDQYLLDAKNVKGGYVVVGDTTERDGLPTATIVEGSLCYCQADDTFYIYHEGAWVEKEFGSTYVHPNSGVSAGTYKSVTVNAQGHITNGSNPTTLAGYGITDAYTKNEIYTKNETDQKLTEFVSAYITSDGGAIDKLQEIANWIDGDKNGSADIIADVEANTQAISKIKSLPDYSTANNDQFLKIVNGIPTWVTMDDGDEVSY